MDTSAGHPPAETGAAAAAGSAARGLATARTAWKDISLVASVAGVSFLTTFFNGALTVSLPTIQRDLSISAANLQWSVSLYALVLGAVSSAVGTPVLG